MPQAAFSPLRVALIGAGRMGLNHARAMARATPGGRLVAVADRSPEAARALASEFPGALAYSSASQLFAAGGLDAVHIVTPPATHAQLARAALAAGLHVYVEKPFAETTEEAREVLDLAAARGLKVCAGHQLLFEPPTAVLERYLPALRGVTHVESYFSFRTVRFAPGGQVPLRPDLQLLDILPHPVYLLLRVLERAAEGPVELAGLTLSRAGTVHALVRRGDVTGSLVVTLEGRPVESYLRVTGRNGAVFADYVRGTAQKLIGPGSSGIDKVLAPYQLARQTLWGTTVALGRRALRRQRSYPGLSELFGGFYGSIRGGPDPITPESIFDTVRVCALVADELRRTEAAARTAPTVPLRGRGVLVTGGTGLLGRAVVRELGSRGRPVRCVARREPPGWEREPGVEYVAVDLGSPPDPAIFNGVETIIHCAAATAGGWAEHQRASLDATRHLVEAAASAGVTRLIHVSSLAVLAGSHGPIGDDGPYHEDSRATGPYVWGKLESERLAISLGAERGVEVRVVRPGALVDYPAFDPPGRLGKRLGGFFVAVGSPGKRLATTEVGLAARALAWMTDHWEEGPLRINLLDPESPTRRELVGHLRAQNPDLTVLWLPTLMLLPLSWGVVVLQKMFRPGRPALNVAKVFASPRFDTSRSRALLARMESERESGPPA